MAVSDLTNTIWYFNGANQITWDLSSTVTYDVAIESNYSSYNGLKIDIDEGYIKYASTMVLEYDGTGMAWVNEAYRTIEITGGTDVTNATLIAWLEANATQQGGGSTAKTQVGTSTIAKKMFGTTPIAKEVVNGVTVYEATPTPSGYSGNIICGSSQMYGRDGNCYIKFGSAPTSASDYDAYADGISETLIGTTSYSNQTVAYIWQGYGFEYNGIDVEIVTYNQTYQTAYQLTLTTNGDITLYPCYED